MSSGIWLVEWSHLQLHLHLARLGLGTVIPRRARTPHTDSRREARERHSNSAAGGIRVYSLRDSVCAIEYTAKQGVAVYMGESC